MNVSHTTCRHFGLALALATLPIFALSVHAQGQGGGPHENNGNIASKAEFQFVWNGADDVTVSSTKDLSHVVIVYCSGEIVKYDDLDVGPEANFSGNGAIDSISAKAGTSTEVAWEPVEHCDGPSEEEIPQ